MRRTRRMRRNLYTPDTDNEENIFLFYNFCPSICQHIIDFPKKEYIKWGIFPKHNYPQFNIDSIKDGDKVYVKPDLIDIFFSRYFKDIKTKFILITSGGALGIPPRFKIFLDNPKILKWYGTNIMFSHDKIHKIPIGFEENERKRGGSADGIGGDQKLLSSLYDDKINFNDKKDKILITYIGNTHESRREIFDKLNINLYDKLEKIPFDKYMEKINEYKFVLCPRGFGIDTHRFWETLLMGSVPIVEKSELDDLYDKFPCIIINSFNDINKDLLDNFLYNFEKSKNIENYLILDNFLYLFDYQKCLNGQK